MGLVQSVSSLMQRLEVLEAKLNTYEKIERSLPRNPDPFYRRRYRLQRVFSRPHINEPVTFIYPALVVDTRDPWKIQRIRVYVPAIHRYENMSTKRFPWAIPCVPAGSLDDQGWAGVPPEGSTVWVFFELGQRHAPVWMGARWNVTRGMAKEVSDGDAGADASSDPSDFVNNRPKSFPLEVMRWGEERFSPMDHNEKTNSDMKQLFPPWNNESYNGPDLKVVYGQEAVSNSAKRNEPTTYPHIYGWKTPEKHFLQMHDGDFNEMLKGKRLVLQSSRGHVLYFKDDCINNSEVLYKHEYWDDFHDRYPMCTYDRAKPYNKHDIWLQKTGIWLQSVGGHRIQFHDEYEKVCKNKDEGEGQNQGPGKSKGKSPNLWYSGFEPQGKLLSKIRIESITDHRFELRDTEDVIYERGTKNGIFGHTATGHLFQMVDHTVDNRAGKKRHIRLFSTSRHLIEMNDEGCKRYAPRQGARNPRADWEDGSQSATATNGFILIQSGWGQFIKLHDAYSQEHNDVQYIRCSNKNDDEDPNFWQMNCEHDDKLWSDHAAGTYIMDVRHNYIRFNWEGSEYITILQGDQRTEIILGADYRHSETIAYYWNSNHISLAVGYIIERGRASELENPLYPVVVGAPATRWGCTPQWRASTGVHYHYDYATPFVDASGEAEFSVDKDGNASGKGRRAGQGKKTVPTSQPSTTV